MDGRIIIVDLVYNDKVNKNGVLVKLEEFKKAVNEERIQEMLANKALLITNAYNFTSDIQSHLTVDMDDVIGNVVSIDTDKLTAVVHIFKNCKTGLYNPNIGLFFAYTAVLDIIPENIKVATDLHILYTVLQSKELSAYK